MTSENEQGEQRSYVTDDRDDPPEERHKLVIFPGGNGDWYLGVWPEGARFSRSTVRLCTSGGVSAVHPLLTVHVARMYRALSEDRHGVPVKPLPEAKQDCPHTLVLPLGNGFGRCEACRDESFPLTAEAAGTCPSCGGHGECLETCDGVPRQPWALARRALGELESVLLRVEILGADVHRSIRTAMYDLKCITGDVQEMQVPGSSLVLTYDGATPRAARWNGDDWARASASLALLGLEVKGGVRAVKQDLGCADLWIYSAEIGRASEGR